MYCILTLQAMVFHFICIFCKCRHERIKGSWRRLMHMDAKKTSRIDKKFQIQNNLTSLLLYFVIDSNRFKQRWKQAKTVIQTATETIGNGDKRKRTWSVHTNEAYGYLCSLWAWWHVFRLKHSAQSSLVKVNAIGMCEWSQRLTKSQKGGLKSPPIMCKKTFYSLASTHARTRRNTNDIKKTTSVSRISKKNKYGFLIKELGICTASASLYCGN